MPDETLLMFCGAVGRALELVMAMAVVCMTVFSCAVNGCFVQPFLFSHRHSGFSSTKPISPAHRIADVGQPDRCTSERARQHSLHTGYR